MSIGEYSVDHFQTLPSLEVARTNFMELNGDDLVKDVFKKFFIEQSMDRTFGLAMLHRHFDLEPDEMLVDYEGTSVPWKSGHVSGMKPPQSAIWAVSSDGEFRPTEFYFSEGKDLNIGEDELGFMKRFQELLHEHNVTQSFGLCRYPGDDFNGLCEITHGRANINLKPNDAIHIHIEIMQQQSFYENTIPIAISQLRSDKEIPTFRQYFDGGQCRVFKVTFADGESWAVRVPLFVHHASQDTVIQLLESEAHILEELEFKGFSWAARLRGRSLTFDNAIEYPFIALTWIPGSQLSWSDEIPTRTLRNKILYQVAVLHTSLIECTKETRGSSLKHFTRIIQNKTRRVREGVLPEITEQDCSDQMNILSNVLLPELDEAPFAIAHGDLSPRNILIDAQHNVTG
ncbi:hypothetical protein N7509_006528 [Penicillium cosmopolitanum]|uniref:Aminoglycoside phosphotransferase domain-containing protein n=1 Tax=Penicillium cosmopolitanum TaxID=1131564 RepID=A0A9W9W0D4_9EURO|nr:uncharacterized protein N7509_006528 [Penicillium cosmopolitanum]KAJ5394741.1 hypothetical protein N7509_006528 [Penicillium cosmopolitanum]